jgi:hypothetical protein
MTARGFWTPLRDNRLLTAWGRGHSVAAIARELGTTTTSVTQRMTRLRELAERPGADPWQRATVARAVETRKRSSGQLDGQRKALARMDKAMAAGLPRGQAIWQCYRAGARSGIKSGVSSGVTWRLIGEHLGITSAAANQAGMAWIKRAQRREANRLRAQAREEQQRKLLREMASAVRRGMPEGQAMARAHRAGATWARIAAHFGMAQQTAHYRAKVWAERARTVRAYRPRRR